MVEAQFLFRFGWPLWHVKKIDKKEGAPCGRDNTFLLLPTSPTLPPLVYATVAADYCLHCPLCRHQLLTLSPPPLSNVSSLIFTAANFTWIHSYLSLHPSHLHCCRHCIYIAAAVASTLLLPLRTSTTRLQAGPFIYTVAANAFVHCIRHPTCPPCSSPPNYDHSYLMFPDNVDITSIKMPTPATIQIHPSPTNLIDSPKIYQKNCSECTRAHRRCVFTSPSHLECNWCNKTHLLCFFNYSGKSL